MAPKPELGVLDDLPLQMTGIASRDLALRHRIGVVGEQGETHPIATTTLLDDIVYYDGHVVLAGEMLGAEQESRVASQESCPQAAMRIARRLVGEHHVGNGDMPTVVVLHHLPDVGLVDNLRPIAGAASRDKLAETLIVQRLANTNGMVTDAAIERGYHVLPVVVVSRHQHNTLVGQIVRLQDIRIVEDITLGDLPQRSAEIVYALGQEIHHVAVVSALEAASETLVPVGETAVDVAPHHLDPISEHIVDKRPQERRKGVEQPQRQICYR